MVDDGTDYEKTMIMKPGSMAPGAGGYSAGRASGFGGLGGARRQRRPATIRVMNGAAAGREVVLTKVVTTVGKPGVQVALDHQAADRLRFGPCRRRRRARPSTARRWSARR